MQSDLFLERESRHYLLEWPTWL